MKIAYKHLAYLLLSGAVATAAACGESTTNDGADTDTVAAAPATDPAPATPPPADATAASPDQDFATKAAATNLAEIRAHEGALNKATSADVKKHAQMMLTDHKKMDADMKTLASSKGLTLPAEPRADKVQMQDEMNKLSGKEWDMAYLDAQVQDHKEAIAMFEDGEKSVQDADLKALITATLPKLRSHLKMVEDARAKMN